MTDDVAAKTEVMNRLRRIEGQVRGVQRMVEEECDGAEVVTQIAAVRAALDRPGTGWSRSTCAPAWRCPTSIPSQRRA